MKNFKFLLFTLVFGLFAYTGFSQDEPVVEDVTVEETLDVAGDETAINIGEITNPPDAGDTNAFVKWWFMIVGVINVAVVWIVGKLWPTDTGSKMKTRSVQIGLGVIVMVILYLTVWRGSMAFDVMTVVQGVIAFIVQGLTYDGAVKPLGVATPRTETYNKAA